MNIVIIMSGGVGARFGAPIPKQYNLIAGRPVIDYVIDAAEASKKTDRILIVMDPQYRNVSEKLCSSDYDFALNGSTRLESMYNGLKYIKEHYSCDKIVVVDAVTPFLYSELIDQYFDDLDECEAVITAQKITGGFTDIYDNELDREKFIITQSPEGFNFELLWNNFDVNYPYQETAGLLPKGSRRKYYYGFKNNLKLTYDFELGYAEYMLNNLGKIGDKNNVAFFDKSILLTEGLKSFLLRTEREETLKWIDDIYLKLPKLLSRWSITSFQANQASRYGLVLIGKSADYGDIVIKLIPPFVDRFDRELEAMQYLPKSYMCKLYDWDRACGAMLLQRIQPSRYASFDENLKLTDFFKKAVFGAVKYTDQKLEYIGSYYEELLDKAAHIDTVPFLRDETNAVLQKAIGLYDTYFADAQPYILHGDLHELNVLDDGKEFWGIDPNGFIAPLELECVRFIRNDVRTHENFGLKERFSILVENFSRFCDRIALVRMFYIDMAFCTFNSTFENSEPDETLLDLELLKIAEEWLSHNAQSTKK